VLVSGEKRRNLGPGDFFGEISMGHRIRATASVVTTTPVRAYVMSYAQFGAVRLAGPVLARLEAATRARRGRLASEVSGSGAPCHRGVLRRGRCNRTLR
jgi:CRP-like cAMP-binding protein